MPEGRFISRSISTSGQLKRVSFEADYLFGRCIPHLDRDGRIDGDPDVVKAVVCPLRSELTPELIATCLAELDSVGLVEWYEVDGQMVVWFPNFREHQQGMKPERERPSRLPSHEAQGVKKCRKTYSGLTPDSVRINSSNVAATSRTNSSQVKSSEVKESEVKESKVKRSKNSDSGESGTRAKYPNFPVSDSNRFHKTCVENGFAVDMGTLRKALSPYYPESGPVYTADQLDAALVAFIEAKGGQSPDRARFWTIFQFTQDVARWIRLGAMPRSDVNGVTERGRVALGMA